MNTIGDQIQSQNLLKIKRIIDNDNNGGVKIDFGHKSVEML